MAKKAPIIPPSLQPRKVTKKAIPGADDKKQDIAPASIDSVNSKNVLATEPPPPVKEEKERFTLWLSQETYRAFKIHTAIRKGSASDYIEALIRKDLNLK